MKIILITLFYTIIPFLVFNQIKSDYSYFESQANFKMERKDYLGAIQILNLATQNYPDSESFHFLKGSARLAMNDFQSSISDLTKAIEICKNGMSFYLKSDERAKAAFEFLTSSYALRGYAKVRIEDNWGAISDFDYVIQNSPNDAQTYYYRGLAKLILNQRRDGCLDLSRAGELGYLEAYKQIKLNCH
jgi:tetratricopeptide (TPR) repeat protein